MGAQQQRKIHFGEVQPRGIYGEATPEEARSLVEDGVLELDDELARSVRRIQASPFIPNKDSIRGFVYEVESGRLRPVE